MISSSFRIIALLASALTIPPTALAQEVPPASRPPTTLPASPPRNPSASLTRNAEFFSKEASGVIRFESQDELNFKKNEERVIARTKGVLYVRNNPDGLSVRCFVLMKEKGDPDWFPAYESILFKGVYSDRDYLRKEEHTRKVTAGFPAPNLQQLTPLAFGPPAGVPVLGILNFYDISGAERLDADTTQVKLTEHRTERSRGDRVTLDIDDNDGQLRRVTVDDGIVLSTRNYQPMERAELGDDKFKFEGPHEGDWELMTPEKEARRARRYGPKWISRPEPKEK